MSIDFIRLEGCGNNFTIFADLNLWWKKNVHNPATAAARLQDRNFGLGGDGLMIINPGSGDVDFEVQMFNPDGSNMGMCGNGIRCAVRFLFLQSLVPPTKSKLSFNVNDRIIVCYPSNEGLEVKVDMGKPSFSPRDLPLDSSGELIDENILVDGVSYRGTAVSMGNPHFVTFVPSLERIELETIGPKIEHHKLFPKRTNVEFAQILSNRLISVKVWERGAGATLACGTGACAAVVAGFRTGKLNREATVSLPGGDLKIEISDEGNVFLIGPAREIASGTLSERLLTRILE